MRLPAGPSLSGDALFALFVTLFVLKVTEVIDLSWWWVTCPLWLPVVLLSVVIAVAIFAVSWTDL